MTYNKIKKVSSTSDLASSYKNLFIEIDPACGLQTKAFELYMDASASISATVAPSLSEKFRQFPLAVQKHREMCHHGELLMRKVDGLENDSDQGTKPYTSGPDYDRKSKIWYATHEELVAHAVHVHHPRGEL